MHEKAFVQAGKTGVAVAFRTEGRHLAKFAERDRREVERAAEYLSVLTLDEIDILSALVCLETADTRSTRSWRGRVLSACAALKKLEPSLLPAATDLARLRRREIDAVFADGEDRWLVSPFTALSDGPEIE
ncbi:hypothetical protein [uncultured Tateyamaria sp.]|uniref:hypothetical protein n=1 Tax=uncultured Tateyamaria sp. TaxID=455651 RepID=UPI00262A6C4C|nr:hypothetical protein [uncultured Tateyamaria sp.]